MKLMFQQYTTHSKDKEKMILTKGKVLQNKKKNDSNKKADILFQVWSEEKVYIEISLYIIAF